MAVQILFTPSRVFSVNATLEPGARAFFYESGTTTPETVYSNEALSTAHPTPLVADATGTFAQVFHSGSPALRCRIYDDDGVLLHDVDPVSATAIGAAAEDTTFSPTADNPSDDVQEAIEFNTALAVANKQLAENALNLATLSGGTTAYTMSAPDTISAYAAEQAFVFLVNATNTGAVTLNVDSNGAKSVKRYNGGVSKADLVAGDWRAGEVHEVTYDGTDFVMTSPVGAKTGGIRGIVEKATTAEAQAGTADDKYPDVVKVKESIAAENLINARAFIDGTAGTPSASGGALNIASVTDNGAGDYTLNFTDDFTNSSYQVSISVHGTGGVGGRTHYNIAPAPGSCRVYMMDATGGAVDRDFTFVAFGPLA